VIRRLFSMRFSMLLLMPLLMPIGSAMLLSACGFQLRGQQDYAFKRLAIAGAPEPVKARLARLVQGGSDTAVVNSPANADAILTLAEGRNFGTLTMNSMGLVEEYQMTYTLTYQLTGKDGTVLIPSSTIALNRAMTYSNQYATAKAAESDLLFADMQNDAVNQLIRRLSLVRSLRPTPEQQVPGVSPSTPLPSPPL
jgi:LPS-assembly lipoprotein